MKVTVYYHYLGVKCQYTGLFGKMGGDIDVQETSHEATLGKTAVIAVAALLMPMTLFLCPLLALALLLGGQSAQATTTAGLTGIPEAYVADVQKAGSICPLVTPQIIAAQIDTESSWNPQAESPAGAKGIAQFMPSTWASVGQDGDGDGKADITNPHDSIWTQGHYMCDLGSQISSLKQQNRVKGDTLELTLAAYNAGLGSIIQYGGIPPYAETESYVRKIIDLAKRKYTSSDSGRIVGQLQPPLAMLNAQQIDIAAMGIAAAAYGGPSGYPYKQCTWWAASRRATIGKPVDAHLGNGGEWGASARRLGYKTGDNPQPGDVISFSPGVLGSDSYYGHVAVVEQVNSDGSIIISESGASLPAPMLRTLTAAQLSSNKTGITFIH
ncbi:lytic transglycosylase domain-containing protein [Bifidobacterium xylocopae]|uniref:Peptidase C51 domain-containing protein n=1 Tax=Bifidobacterium xylocopae TaxID=2493119 RepID=A0A366KC27_9BIFI|nr:lytic transglycosylase domain-containing protein [Bifidobacterium xylocopae]RBP98917.1 hypothetical protein CRD59_06690 [Bifidobacterium xylocopae]